MNPSPLVTVAMPCYNRAATLPMALASLVAQTYAEWECVLVDDGSTDASPAVASALGDPRIRIVRLDTHAGRGVARQAALDAARGDYFSLLDTDDWLYPDKLARQLQLLADLPEAGAVGSGIAVVNAAQELVGVRGRAAAGAPLRLVPPVQATMPPPLARVALMMRMGIARRCRYDPRLRRSEDTDFVLQLLAQSYHCVLPGSTYVYRQERAGAYLDNLSSYGYRMRVIWKHRERAYRDALGRLAVTGAKAALYGLFALLGADAWLIRRRSQPATPVETAEFAQAKAVVLAHRERLFGSLPQPASASEIQG